MITKPSILKLWAVNLLVIPIFAGGLWIIGFPMQEKAIWIFLGVAFPPFTLISALFGSFLTSTQVDEFGVVPAMPMSGRIPWDKVKSVRKQWPFIHISSGFGRDFALLPVRWLMKNRREFDETLSQLAETNEVARQLQEKA